MRVLLVDDHELVRRGIEQALRTRLPDLELAEAASAEEALAALQGPPFELVILDLSLPGRGGLELLEELRRLWPALKVLVVSAFAEEEFALRCLRLGARGFVGKTAGSSGLLTAVDRVMRGGRYLSPRVAELLASTLGGEPGAPPHEALSARELQVLKLVAQGRTNKEVSAELRLSERTIATYRARIGEKTGLHGAVEIARYALQHKLSE